MTNNEMVKCAARALLKLTQKVNDLETKVAQFEAKERALVIAHKLASTGAIEYGQVLEKAASLAKEDLNVIEKAMDLNIGNLLSIGSAEITKEATEKTGSASPDNGNPRKSFEDFLVSTFS